MDNEWQANTDQTTLKAILAVIRERYRQIAAKDDAAAHDDKWERGELALAAALYALPYETGLVHQDDYLMLHMALDMAADFELKPEPDVKKRIIKAAAMLLAEFERLERAEAGAIESTPNKDGPRDGQTGALVRYAADELKRAGMFGEDSDYDGWLGVAVLRMIELFASERHSGIRALLAIDAFSKLARSEPLTPLTGEDGEWLAVDEGLYQNRRAGRVFKDEDGAYDIEGKVFRQPNGVCFTAAESRVPITFPYVPQSDYVDVADEGGEA